MRIARPLKLAAMALLGVALTLIEARGSAQVLELPGSEFRMDLGLPGMRACVFQPPGRRDENACRGLPPELLEVGRRAVKFNAVALVREEHLEYWVMIQQGGSTGGGCAAQRALTRENLGDDGADWQCEEKNVAGVPGYVFEVAGQADAFEIGYVMRGASGLVAVLFIMESGTPEALRDRSRALVESSQSKPAPAPAPLPAPDVEAAPEVSAAPLVFIAFVVVGLGVMSAAFWVAVRRRRARARAAARARSISRTFP
jgi:hypothetical protein